MRESILPGWSMDAPFRSRSRQMDERKYLSRTACRWNKPKKSPILIFHSPIWPRLFFIQREIRQNAGGDLRKKVWPAADSSLVSWFFREMPR
jgi:hypothetical protein